MQRDPPENGKGGGMLDGKLWRDFPGVRAVQKPRETAVKNACEREHYWQGEDGLW